MPKWLIIVLVVLAIIIMSGWLVCHCVQSTVQDLAEGVESTLEAGREIGKNGTMEGCIKATVAAMESCDKGTVGVMKCGMQTMPFLTGCLDEAPLDQALCDSMPPHDPNNQQAVMEWAKKKCEAHGVTEQQLCPGLISSAVGFKCMEQQNPGQGDGPDAGLPL